MSEPVLFVRVNTDYSDAELTEMVRAMKGTASAFYVGAVQSGCHTFIEFTGLLNEYIKLCDEARARGVQFPFRTNDAALELQPHNIAYIAEKLNCIYGGTWRRDP